MLLKCFFYAIVSLAQNIESQNIVITRDMKQSADFSGADKNTALQENPVETTFPSSK